MNKQLIESQYALYFAELRNDRKALDRETVPVLRESIQKSIDHWSSCISELEVIELRNDHADRHGY